MSSLLCKGVINDPRKVIHGSEKTDLVKHALTGGKHDILPPCSHGWTHWFMFPET